MTERLWAPWRMQYVSSAREQPEECLFCARAKAPCSAESMVLWRGEHAFVMLNAFPYTNGHLMVAPVRHTADLNHLVDEELLEVMHLVRQGINLLHEAYHPDGFNIGVNLGRAAGAGIVDHIHWHIVPRWNGDTNFMPVLADVRVIPDSLENTYRTLYQILSRRDGNQPDAGPVGSR
ncbi:MAG: HIT domain-containing protein [Armatimonadota bacterium]|nr:HIT domain-containing protein [bacterium]MCS7309406.1 HIT domain-containing protein [Armatimonadota bacterium]MDW8105235.1 HIT domain-containing protein [Armatimonadota bacterium]MDW8289150.1 HIT domain-containing protein [Armatimonadota bacterium]